MILSMTGFAATSAELPGASLVAELRSVNHRYLDLSIRLPDELRSLEPALREKLSGQLKRGKVELRLGLNRSTPGATSLAVDPVVAEFVVDCQHLVGRRSVQFRGWEQHACF